MVGGNSTHVVDEWLLWWNLLTSNCRWLNRRWFKTRKSLCCVDYPIVVLIQVWKLDVEVPKMEEPSWIAPQCFGLVWVGSCRMNFEKSRHFWYLISGKIRTNLKTVLWGSSTFLPPKITDRAQRTLKHQSGRAIFARTTRFKHRNLKKQIPSKRADSGSCIKINWIISNPSRLWN